MKYSPNVQFSRLALFPGMPPAISWDLARFVCIAAVVSVIGLSGCSVLQSERQDLTTAQDSTQANPRAANSLMYYLPSGRLHIIGTKDDSETWTLNIETTYVPDVHYAIYLSYQDSPLSEDDILVSLSPEGFLAKIESTTEDKTPAIAIAAAQLAREVMKLTALAGAGVGAKPKQSFDIVIDPFNPNDLSRLQTLLGVNKCKVDFTLDSSKASPPPDFTHKGFVSTPNKIAGGIFYRPCLPYRLTVRNSNDTVRAGTAEQSIIVSLPNRSPLLQLNINRAAFVKNQTTLAFDHGVLQSIRYKKPSEALGFITIPVDIAKAFASLPSSATKDLITINVVNKTDPASKPAGKADSADTTGGAAPGVGSETKTDAAGNAKATNNAKTENTSPSATQQTLLNTQVELLQTEIKALKLELDKLQTAGGTTTNAACSPQSQPSSAAYPSK